jgi:hypothetical protein
MSGYIINIEEATTKNESYREVLFTARHTQLVLMSLKPGEEIGEDGKTSILNIRARLLRKGRQVRKHSLAHLLTCIIS